MIYNCTLLKINVKSTINIDSSNLPYTFSLTDFSKNLSNDNNCKVEVMDLHSLVSANPILALCNSLTSFFYCHGKSIR